MPRKNPSSKNLLACTCGHVLTQKSTLVQERSDFKLGLTILLIILVIGFLLNWHVTLLFMAVLAAAIFITTIVRIMSGHAPSCAARWSFIFCISLFGGI